MGNREDVRWNALTDAAGNGIQFVAIDGMMSASAMPWSDIEMTLASHPYELPESSGVYVHIDKKVLGLGGASCGQGITMPEGRVYAGPQTFGFIIRPVVAGVNLQKQAQVSSAGQRPLSISRNNVGTVTITSADPDAKILFNIVPDGKRVERGRYRAIKATEYTEPIPMRNGGTLTVWEASTPELKTTLRFAKIEKVPLTVTFTSAAEPGEGGERLVDGDPSTIWHSTYGVTVALYPHWVEFDCGEVKMLKGFTYLPRQSGSNGDIKDWKLEVSSNGTDWTNVADGTFVRNKDEKKVMFKQPVKARYVRFTGLNSQDGQDFASGAEFSVLAD